MLKLIFQGLPLELTVNILTASYWPQQIVASTPCTFSDQLLGATSLFQKYYDSRHSGRRLTWQGNLGTADVKVRFKARSHDLNVSTHALVVLLLFEDLAGSETLSYSVSRILRSPDLN
jgi:cullin 3